MFNKKIKFDRLKLMMPLNAVVNPNLSKFETRIKDDEVVSYEYRQAEPFLLNITINLPTATKHRPKHRLLARHPSMNLNRPFNARSFNDGDVIIEFTAKILQENYPMLIHSGTIRDCLTKINVTLLCAIDIDKAINQSIVLKCDVTADVTTVYVNSLNQLATNTILTNHTKWQLKNYHNGVVLEKTVDTDTLKRRLTVYDKYHEFTKKNPVFFEQMANGTDQAEYFENVLRYELNVKSFEQIRKLLEISDNSLTSVLASTADPIMTVLNDACETPVYQYHSTSLKDYRNEVFLRYHDNDLRKVEAAIRKYANSNTSITRLMTPYRELYNSTISNFAPDLKQVYWTNSISPVWLPYSPNSPLIL